MRDKDLICDFCYRRATRTLVQARRRLRQVLANKPRRQAEVCETVRCEHVATDYLYGRKPRAEHRKRTARRA